MRRGARQAAVAAVGFVLWCAASCRDVPAPEGGVFSLSTVILPSPGVVVGDTMRDSVGLVAPIRILAYGVSGDTVSSAGVLWVAADTFAHFSGARLIGDHVSSNQRIIAVLAGLQSQPVTAKVTLSPDTLVATDSLTYRKTWKLTDGDTVILSPEISASVLHTKGVATATGVEATIVKFAIVRTPQTNGNGPIVVLMNGNIASSRDTTDAGGRASRVLRLRLAAQSGAAVDTAQVTATASYAGKTLGNVTYTVIFTKQ